MRSMRSVGRRWPSYLVCGVGRRHATTTEPIEQELFNIAKEMKAAGAQSEAWAQRIDVCCEQLRSLRLGEAPRRWIRVETADELDAVLRGCLRDDAASAQDQGSVPSYLLTKPMYVLPGTPTHVRGNRRVDLFVDVGLSTTIVGAVSITKGAKLVLNGGITLRGDEGMPCVEVSGANSRFKVCASEAAPVVLTGGRDGVYLSGGAQCELTYCAVEGNHRGIFEGFRCKAVVEKCRFTKNLFHCVLLGDRSRCRSDIIASYASSNELVSSDYVRGDYVFSYNPVCDIYEEVHKDGGIVVLASSNNTLGLTDPSW
jgi:hypothetical protein